MITADMIAAKASRILGQTVTANMVREIDNARKQLEVQMRMRVAGQRVCPKGSPPLGTTLRCVCGCGRTFVKKHSREKIHPSCRPCVYADRGLLALCKLRTPEVI